MAPNPSEATVERVVGSGAGDRRARDARSARPAGNGRRRRAGEPRRRERFAARKVRRLIRHIDPWSVLKLSLLLFLCLWVIVMIAGVIVWTVATSTGTIDKIESMVNTLLGQSNFRFNGDFLFRQMGIIGMILTLAMTAATTVMAVVFNLISDIIGGVWITVIEEETARPVSGSPSPPTLL
ncbi:MAG: DUF3566 domain-containing protein [Microthrixaceae bacterium]|nr:DUF3566 domain-containing protein [Microthrixaceae bacterium]